MKTLGILAHSAEGAGLCFLTACRHGATLLGEHMHPPIVLSAIPMGLSMPGWRADDPAQIEPHLVAGAERLAQSGAAFFICPDNTAHLVLDRCIGRLPLPGLHIADVIVAEIRRRRFQRVGLLGTRWTMNGEVYRRALSAAGVDRLVPDAGEQETLHGLIFDELCNGRFGAPVTEPFLRAIERLRAQGAEAVILGCTEIPIIISDANSVLPTLDTTRLLARHAVELAVADSPFGVMRGWIPAR